MKFFELKLSFAAYIYLFLSSKMRRDMFSNILCKSQFDLLNLTLMRKTNKLKIDGEFQGAIEIF